MLPKSSSAATINPKVVPGVTSDGGCEITTRCVAGAGVTVIGPVVTEGEAVRGRLQGSSPTAAVSVVMKAWKLATPPTRRRAVSGPLKVALPGLF